MDLLPLINVLAELDRHDIKWDYKTDDEVVCLCPFHTDKSPGCHVNVKKRVFKCFVAGCEQQGDIIKFIAGHVQQTPSIVALELAKRYGVQAGKLIGADVVERAHQNIWAARILLKELYERGVTDDLIRKRRYGEIDGRVAIPVKSKVGLYINIRKYLPGAPGKQKMRNMKGCGQPALYPIDQLEYQKIVWCGGELKADVAAEQINQHGYGAICQTSGEGNFDLSLLKEFAGKDIYICLDVDKAGQVAAQLRAGQFYNVANSVHIVTLPLDTLKYPKGDINDFVHWEKGELLPLLEKAEEWHPKANKFDDSEPVDLELQHAINAAQTGKRLRVKAIISSMDTAPYSIPAKVTTKCDRNQNVCALCPVFAGGEVWDIHREDPSILEMVQATKNGVREGVMSALGVPRTCPSVTFEAVEHYNVEDVRISPQLAITNRSSDRIVQPALCIGREKQQLELNESYHLVGRMYPHPKSQQSTLLIGSYDAAADALGSYECKDLEDLRVFQPDEWTVESIQSRLDEIYADFEANVTHIFQRRDMHLLVDLAYHSPLHLTFDGRADVKGWVEVLLVGDSAQGKSEITCGSSGAGGLMAHYGLGEKVECKNASPAGLVGGLQQTGNRFWVSWGLMPMHDKRLLIWEELKGLSPENIGKTTDMRSSGVAIIDKIEKKRTHARVRLIANSNTRSNMPVSTYNFGVEVIRELVALEDIRRFDAFYVVSAGDIDAKLLNQQRSQRAQIEHRYVGSLCRKLVLWGWTRPVEKVLFDEEATKKVLEAAAMMSDKYARDIPVIDPGSARYKIARLAAALACRTFSTAESVEVLLVRGCHVDYVVQKLMQIYDSPTFGYLDYTKAMAVNQTLVDIPALKKKIENLPFPLDFCKQILHTNKIDLQDIQDWCGWDRMEATALLSLMVRKHALRRDGRAYRKTSPFIALLKQLVEGGNLEDRPDFIPEQEY